MDITPYLFRIFCWRLWRRLDDLFSRVRATLLEVSVSASYVSPRLSSQPGTHALGFPCPLTLPNAVVSAPQWPSTSSYSISRTSSTAGSPSGRRTAISTAIPLPARGRRQSPAAGHIDPRALTPYPSPQLQGAGGVERLWSPVHMPPLKLLYLRKHHGDEMP